jgi:hypothetical protein
MVLSYDAYEETVENQKQRDKATNEMLADMQKRFDTIEKKLGI